MAKKRLVYISHPYGGDSKNVEDIEKIITHLYQDERLYNNFCFVSPVHAFGFMYQIYESEYYKGLQLCLDILDYCEQMLMVGDWETSKGCTGEKAYCEEHGIPYTIVRTSDEIVNTSYDKLFEILDNKGR